MSTSIFGRADKHERKATLEKGKDTLSSLWLIFFDWNYVINDGHKLWIPL